MVHLLSKKLSYHNAYKADCRMMRLCEWSHVACSGARGGERSSVRLAAVHVVTSEEASSGAFSIGDVVLPLPGAQVQFPRYPAAETSSKVASALLAIDLSKMYQKV